jgi:ubiquinone/menaquinone biosynthesis C-methylase UbiE
MVAAVFDRAAETYDSVGVPWFTPIAEHLVRELAPVPGEQILDLGSGRGAAVFPLAEAVGPTGHVTGIDLAEGMVRALRSDVAARGLTWAAGPSTCSRRR